MDKCSHSDAKTHVTRQFIYISHFLEEEMGRGRGWLHCAFSCPVSADGSCWALCCIPWAPHHCLMVRGLSIPNRTSQLHGALPNPGHFAVGPTSPIHLLSLPVPPLTSPCLGRLLLENQPHLQLRWSLACSLWWDAKLPGFIPEGFSMLPVPLSRPLTRGDERKHCNWRM